jgi:hypothetical protein
MHETKESSANNVSMSNGYQNTNVSLRSAAYHIWNITFVTLQTQIIKLQKA